MGLLGSALLGFGLFRLVALATRHNPRDIRPNSPAEGKLREIGAGPSVGSHRAIIGAAHYRRGAILVGGRSVARHFTSAERRSFSAGHRCLRHAHPRSAVPREGPASSVAAPVLQQHCQTASSLHATTVDPPPKYRTLHILPRHRITQSRGRHSGQCRLRMPNALHRARPRRSGPSGRNLPMRPGQFLSIFGCCAR